MILILALAAAMWNYNRMTGNVKLYVKKPKPLLASSIDEMKKEAEQRRSQRQRKQAVSQKRAALRASCGPPIWKSATRRMAALRLRFAATVKKAESENSPCGYSPGGQPLRPLPGLFFAPTGDAALTIAGIHAMLQVYYII